MFGLTRDELRVLKNLSTPRKIQDFLDTLPVNWEKNGETNMSPRRVLREQRAHCMEGAMLAAVSLWLQGEEPFLLDLVSAEHDDDHVVAMYKVNGLWGAISKTNHATLRFRDPIYRNARELALSYFHEFFLSETGSKTLRSYSLPYSLKKHGTAWITDEDELWDLAIALDDSPHRKLFPKSQIPYIRTADPMERKAGAFIEWKRTDTGT